MAEIVDKNINKSVIVNKHFDSYEDIKQYLYTDVFDENGDVVETQEPSKDIKEVIDNRQDYKKGEIIVVNDIDDPSLYVIDTNNRLRKIAGNGAGYNDSELRGKIKKVENDVSGLTENKLDKSEFKTYQEGMGNIITGITESIETNTNDIKTHNTRFQTIESSITNINTSIGNIDTDLLSIHGSIIDIIGDEEKKGIITETVNEAKNTIDEYTINNKKISENPVINSDDINLSQDYTTQNITGDTIVPNDLLTSVIAKLEVTMANTALAFAAAVNDLDLRIGVPSDYNVRTSSLYTLIEKINYGIKTYTYEELKILKENKKLVEGQQYRISNYMATVNEQYADKVIANDEEKSFNIIVTAINSNTFSEIANVENKSENSYYEGQNLFAWKVWYCFDNDTNRFDWADIENGKGVIYRMIDERNNDCSYDFKGIKFIYDTNISYFTFTIEKNGNVSDKSLNTTCYNNTIKSYYSGTENKMSLPINWFITTASAPCYNNSLGENNTGNKFGASSYCNVFGNNCQDNKMDKNCRFNIFDNACSNNTMSSGCTYNTLFNKSSNNKFGTSCRYNTMGHNTNYNEMGDSCDYNELGNNASNNKFGKNSSKNKIGINSSYNTFGESFESNVIHNSCNNNIFGSGCTSNILDNDCDSNVFGNNCDDNHLGNSCKNNTLGESFESNIFLGCNNNIVFNCNWGRFNVVKLGVNDLNIITNDKGSEENLLQHYTFTINSFNNKDENENIICERNKNEETILGQII